MKRLAQSRSGGFTLIEMAIVIVAIAVLAAYAIVRFGEMTEDADATMVRTSQALLQQTLTQAAIRRDRAPITIFRDNPVVGNNGIGDRDLVVEIVNSQLTSFNRANRNFNDIQNWPVICNAVTCTLRTQSGRGATFSVTPNGQFQIVQLINNNGQNWNRHQVLGGNLSRIRQ
jgi:prepilin-type N-terminal cleavage/methylation domain-containing protein